MIRKECAAFAEVADEEKPIIEVTLRGQLGFKNSLLRLDKLKERAIDQFQPLGLMINNKTVPRQLAVATGPDQDVSPTAREVRIIEDLIKPDSRFGRRAADLASVVIEVKRLTLEGEAPEKLYKLIEERLFRPASVPVDQTVPDPVPAPVQQWPGEGPGLQSELLPFAELLPPEAAEAATADRRD